MHACGARPASFPWGRFGARVGASDRRAHAGRAPDSEPDRVRTHIHIRGAREHNLKGLEVRLPRDRLVVITGVSGSGKSSLAFDTIFREGQRRFLQSFSAHARQYLGRLQRARVESIRGLSPTLAVGQQGRLSNPRSTVGTLSEIWDLLRLLYARVGRGPDDDPGAPAPPRESRLFSFNTVEGACPECQGLGEQDRVDPELLVADPERSLRQGALVPTTPTGYIVYSQVTIDVLDEVCRAHGFGVDQPWATLTEAQRDVVFYGSDRVEVAFGKHPLESRLRWSGITARPRDTGHYKGLVPTLEEIIQRNRNKNAMRFARSRPCEACGGSRLGPAARAVRVRDTPIARLATWPLPQLAEWLREPFAATQATVAEPITEAALARLALLDDLGLSYLTLARPAASLSGGEAQRLRLATQVGSRLQGVLYVLDEPSAGLHVRDNQRLLRVLGRLRSQGNSVVVVEHDADVMRAADWIVDIGPDAGQAGGELLYSGPVPGLLAEAPATPSHTRAYLTGERALHAPTQRRPGREALRIRGARGHNLQHIDVELRVGALNGITGVSGAGKSSLVVDTLGRALATRLHGARRRPLPHDGLEGAEAIDKIIVIDQSPIGRTPRSNPATYTKVFDRIRGLFADQPLARERGYGKGRFSFNAKGGRCEACEGAGVQHVGLQLLGDVAVTCEACDGRRFNDETLAVRLQGRSVADVLQMSIDEAHAFFAGEPAVQRVTGTLARLGLGYLRLGQPSTTLSGGEAQRVKLATELARPGTGQTLYLLDEPTTGLHDHDIQRLLEALQGLVDAGNTVVAIEHHPAVIRAADWVVDLGPEGGTQGGRVVAMGPPEQIAATPGSHTGRALSSPRGEPSAPPTATSGPGQELGPQGPADLCLSGVTTHNLQGVDVRIPAGSLTVITGVSGSGKSSLALDTLVAEGQRRFTESLSTYARRFLEQLPAPPVRAVAGLSPTVAVTQRRLAPNPRSTVGTLSEVYDLYRLLYARAGVPHCPEHDASLADGPCPSCGREPPGPLSASHFSFNHHLGACPTCDGQGVRLRADPQQLVTAPERPLTDGALDGHKTGRFYGEPDGQYVAILRRVGEVHGIDFAVPWRDLSAEARQLAMQGTGDRVYDVVWQYRRGKREGEHRFERPWPGFLALVDEEYARKQADHRGEVMRAVLTERRCPDCGGERLAPLSRAVRVDGQTLGALGRLTVDEARSHFSRGAGPPTVAPLIQAIRERLDTLADVGLGYLRPDRRADSLSGGEARRLQLAALLGADLCGITFVLDEPTLGLHAADTAPLICALKRLRDLGNTVVVVEHDLDVIRAADWILELGPGAGEAGGQVVAQGTPAAVADGETLTARALCATTPPPAAVTPLSPGLQIRGAQVHNLAALRLSVPAGGLVAVTGVSGSGKSSLVFDVIHASAAAGAPRGCDDLQGLEGFERVVRVDDAPIGTSNASNPATYSGLFDDLRGIFARSPQARERRYGKGRFSFQSKAGQCSQCKGQGALRTPMGFLADVWVTCSACGGARFNDETLAVRVQGLTIADVLQLTVAQAAVRFHDHRRLARGLARFAAVGLGYLRLGQPAPTLSGGEAQRLKLVTELIRHDRRPRRRDAAPLRPTLFLFDEPTVGLHHADVSHLLRLFASLREAGHTLVVVEHHLDVIRAADWVLDLGPGGGPAGGRLVAEGPPANLAAHPDSVTGQALRDAHHAAEPR